MGFHTAWIASRAARELVLSTLGFSVEGQSEEPVYDPGLYGVALPGGWYLTVGDGWDFMAQLGEGQAAALSREGETLFFATDDSSMSTRLSSFQRGKLVWAVTYDGSNGVGQPELEGNPPQVVREAQAQVESAQTEAGDRSVDHIYDLTALVGQALVGFRHDETLANDEAGPIDLLTAS
jgi:hypothetical protein